MFFRPGNGSLRRSPLISVFVFLFFTTLPFTMAACGGSSSPVTSTRNTPVPAAQEVLTLPNVGTSEISTLDPAQGPDQNSALAVGMIYSGLVRTDKNLNVIPDQATWQSSADDTVYTFTLKPGLTFSDGTPVTAHDYVYTWTRALLPATKSPVASFFEAQIVGADAVSSGKSTTLAGVKALNDVTLQVTLKGPTPYFLEELTTSLFFPLNKKVIDQFGDKDWAQHVVGNGVGTGPFMVKQWVHNAKMVLIPNPHYYGNKTRLHEVDMVFVSDPATAFKSYQANQYSLVWNIDGNDQLGASTLPGFTRQALLQTDMLFFDNTQPPFNNVAVRQAFAYAIDKTTLANTVLKGSVQPASTIIPPGMPGYQPNYAGLGFDAAKAKALFQSVYPDVTKVPPITFSYPNSQVSSLEAQALQQMWQNALGIQVKLLPVELTAYNDETAHHLVQFGFTQWGADFPDPYDWLTLNLFSTASNNNGSWHNARFDQLVTQAETKSGSERIALYHQAEQLAITDVGWLPLDHQTLAAVIPPQVHGVTLNGNGLYFGDWSGVYLSQR
ncbi:MAG TPA: peptide ABC transporter substrate-binding protein [Ktedonobacteraceae bacterium]|jgi:oligopeptide transport system substrate-binding protein|nr:peptide ABC transporter substrate-binding protein [Ktedonobacteraceae bacterium]